jgi:Rad3-related DNA helicase
MSLPFPRFRQDGDEDAMRKKKRGKASIFYENSKQAKDVKIVDLLGSHLARRMRIVSANNDGDEIGSKEGKIAINRISSRPMEGDLPSLALRCEFFMGVKVGWPFPAMLKPQSLMAMHIIKGLKDRKHVVLESPTGTGKSAAILCSVLAWQRYHTVVNSAKTSNDEGIETIEDPKTTVVQILYCTRTHSQVAQMVKSLLATPYRPRMTVLGSRDRLCIHGCNDSNKKFHASVNHDCRTRVINTENQRRAMLEAQKYNDEHPPRKLESDDLEISQVQQPSTASEHIPQHTTNDMDTSPSPQPLVLNKPTCPHYRSLGTSRTAKLVVKNFVPNSQTGQSIPDYTTTTHHDDVETLQSDTNVNKHGIHDIEDLVAFGRNPERLNGEADDENYTACPYYVSRALAKHAEIVFCPYNYVLDPQIRKSLSISLENTVVVLDEAHNVEDTLRGSGSGTWSEILLCEMIAALQWYAGATKTYYDRTSYSLSVDKDLSSSPASMEAGMKKEEDTASINEMAHELLLFLEKIVLFLLDQKGAFEKNGQAERAVEEWRRFNTPDNTSFEMTYDGPSGYGVGQKSIGCQHFFDRIGCSRLKPNLLREYAEKMNVHAQERSGPEALVRRNLFEQLQDTIAKLTVAMEQPQHFFVQSKVQPNGSFHFASGELIESRQRQRRPNALPLAPGRTAKNPQHPIDSCRFCRYAPHDHRIVPPGGVVQHGQYNNGSTPRWESVLVLELLTPSLFMQDLSRQCHSVILASGSLAPLPSLCAELGLHSVSTSNVTDATTKLEEEPRLQDRPPPLEADHVISLEHQLLAVAIGHFPNGEPISVTYNNYKHDHFVEKLGNSLASVIESIPRGGVLVFLPSYSLLKRCIKIWNPESYFHRGYNKTVWNRLLESKGKIIVEPTGTQTDFESARDEFAETIRTTGKCILFAVFRGKMSEGISFNDDNARGVICVGIPFPSAKDRPVTAKKNYNDEMRRIGKRADLLSGDSWYKQQAYRAIAQALGRCIRHAGDYGTVVLVDLRFCDESPPDSNGVCQAHLGLPKWMRAHVKTLTARTNHNDSNRKIIGGGWQGLQDAMKSFFHKAPEYASAVLQKQKRDLQEARKLARISPNNIIFDRSAGQWTNHQQ